MLPSRFYEDFLSDVETLGMNCDIYDKDGKYHIEMDIPGFKKDEIKIECHKGTITISAKKVFNKEEHEGKKFIRHERRYNNVERSFYLGDIDEENINASFNDGILNITVPTTKEKEKRIITIE